jgi:hypothetical protein
MSIDIVNQTVDVNSKCEQITLMDSYGAQYQLCVPVSTAPADRATQIQNAIALMQTNEANLVAVATAQGYNLSAQQTTATAQKATLIAAMPAAVATIAKAAVTTAVAAISAASTVSAATPTATPAAPATTTSS